jgi:hypothetical protein
LADGLCRQHQSGISWVDACIFNMFRDSMGDDLPKEVLERVVRYLLQVSYSFVHLFDSSRCFKHWPVILLSCWWEQNRELHTISKPPYSVTGSLKRSWEWLRIHLFLPLISIGIKKQEMKKTKLTHINFGE